MLKVLEQKVAFGGFTTGFLIIFSILAWFYNQKNESVYVISAALLFCVWTVYSLWYVCLHWLRFIEAEIKQYREKNSLASGVTVLLSFFLYLILAPSFFLYILRNGLPDIIRSGFSTYLQIIIAIMPAVLGLLGVQYTIAIQNSNRKEDMRLAQKPFLTLKYMVGGFTQIADCAPHAFFLHFQIKNISGNIAIPIGFGENETNELSFWFPYSPISSTGVIKAVAEISSKSPITSDTYTIKFYYKDILDNYYCSCICIQLSNMSKYETPIVCSEFLCTPKTVEWLKETAFSKSSDYWGTYEITT